MPSVAAAFVSVFGEALLHPGDTERDLGLRYAEALRNLGPLAAPTLQHMFNLRLREQMREAVISQAELQSGRSRLAARDGRLRRHRRLHRGSARTSRRRTWAPWCGASSARSPRRWSHRCGS